MPFETFRPRGGATYTIAAGADTTVFTLPPGSREIVVTASDDFGRVLVSSSDTPVTPDATNMGYLNAGIPMVLYTQQGRDAYLHLSSTVADNVITVTWGN